MKLNKHSWHYKMWASTFERGMVPYSTDLCRYCHRVFWRLVLWAFLGTVIAALLFACGYGLIYKGLICNTLLTLEVGGILAGAISVVCLYLWWLNKDRSYSEPRTLVGKFARASKQKVCPLVEFADDEDD